MGNQGTNSSDKPRFLFNVDILIEAENNGVALERLLHVLNEASSIPDYKIRSGIDLGKSIDIALSDLKKNKEAAAKSQAAAAESSMGILKHVNEFIANNTLIRLNVLKGKGIKLSIPCRIVNYDSISQTVTVYHVDEKKVYQFRLSEIEEFTVA